MSARTALRPAPQAPASQAPASQEGGSQEGASPPSPAAFADRVRARPPLVAVPLYRRPDLARQVAAALVACAPEIAALGGEVRFYDDSPDDPSLAQALAQVLAQVQAVVPARIVRNPRNLGFVGTCNRAIEEAVERGFDLLLLNSDAVPTPGAIMEMARVALADPMTGFVNPRSNNATLATLPFQDRFRHLPVEAARAAWAAIAPHLPRVSYAPTSNGFCMWVRWAVLAEFGGFDAIYGRGYNEENDLVMRAGRRGWRAVLANHAFVWHEGSASFGPGDARHALERVNRAVLLARYPEYPGLTEAYFTSPEQRAEILLGALIPDADGRLDVAVDFSSFVAAHNGTFTAGVQLLRTAAVQWRHRFNVHVLCAADAYAFHGMETLGVTRCEPYGAEVFAAIFRVGQPYDRGALEKLALKGATFGVFMLDTISLDSAALYDPATVRLWAYVAEHADLIATTSAMTGGQLERRFAIGAGVARLRSLHSLDLADYALPPPGPGDAPAPPGYVFVVGNHYWHKDVAAAVDAIAVADPLRRVVVLGGGEPAADPVDAGDHAPRPLRGRPNVVRLAAGRLSEAQMSALYAGAAAVVVPSHYEGFGIPVLNALAARRPVFVRPLPVFQELWEALGGDTNIHLFQTTADLAAALADAPAWDAAGASSGRPGDAERAARDVGEALDRAIANADYARIVRRIALLPPGPPRTPEPTSPRAFIARRAGRWGEAAAAAVLGVPGVLPVLRSLWRLGRLARRPG